MKYQPITAVWEITFACNMRCKHCGSSCNTKKPDELTQKEALKLCDQIAELGLEYITLSGGEPLLREDWHKLAQRLKEGGVKSNIITNGWFLTEKEIKKAKESGITNIAISLDGLEQTHDFLRAKGSYERIMSSLDLLKKNGMPSSIITTINKKNIGELPELYKILVEKNVKGWQMQYAMPMGNFTEHSGLVIEPTEIDDIINLAHEFSEKNIIKIELADCVGYYNEKEIEVKVKGRGKPEDFFWTGCPAGKYVLGIRYNGDIIGCTSLRDDDFIEDNIRNRSLVDIWNGPESFSWNRNLTKKDLTGFCANCQYGSYCLAGCSVLKFTTGKKLKENKYCSYSVAVEKDLEEINQIHDHNKLLNLANSAIQEENFQFADACLKNIYENDQKNLIILNHLGLVNYRLENYEKSLQFIEEALSIDPKNAYAWKGKGVCLASLGKFNEGINCLETAIENASNEFLDPYFDLSVIYYNKNEFKKAKSILTEGRKKSKKFKEMSEELYQSIENNLQ